MMVSVARLTAARSVAGDAGKVWRRRSSGRIGSTDVRQTFAGQTYAVQVIGRKRLMADCIGCIGFFPLSTCMKKNHSPLARKRGPGVMGKTYATYANSPKLLNFRDLSCIRSLAEPMPNVG